MNIEQKPSGEIIKTSDTKPASSKPTAPSLEELNDLMKKGDTSAIMNSLGKNIDSYPAGSLPKEYANILADTEKGGGYPKDALYNFDKFTDLTAQEMAIDLINSDKQAFVLLGLEKKLKENKMKLEGTEKDGGLNTKLEEASKSGYKDGDEKVDQLKSEINKISTENSKIEKVLSSIDKNELLEIASKKHNFLLPERMPFFIEGIQPLEINYTDLVSNMIDSKYSPSYLKRFIEESPDGSLDKSLIPKLKSDSLLQDIDIKFASKFQE